MLLEINEKGLIVISEFWLLDDVGKKCLLNSCLIGGQSSTVVGTCYIVRSPLLYHKNSS